MSGITPNLNETMHIEEDAIHGLNILKISSDESFFIAEVPHTTVPIHRTA
jgi:hypothetical protein